MSAVLDNSYAGSAAHFSAEERYDFKLKETIDERVIIPESDL